MKNIKQKIVATVLLMLCTLTASAYDVEVDGIYFDLNYQTKEAVVTRESESSYYSGSVVIPENITFKSANYKVVGIGDSAFYGCWALSSITIPNSVTSIGNSAFGSCFALSSIIIPNSITSIGEEAFCYTGLTSITIPASVISLGNKMFYGCSGLTSFEVETDNKYYFSENNVIFDKTKTTLFFCLPNKKGTYSVPNSVTSIGDWAFSGCSGLTSVTIPNSVTSIGEWAFSGCSGLTSVTIPNSVTSIGEWAFDNCSGLTSVSIPNSVTSIGDWAFSGCSGLTSVTIPNSVTSIGDWAFSWCSGLTSVTIPNSVTSIGERAFVSCSSLTSVTIPNSVTSIGENAFGGCPIEFLSIDSRNFCSSFYFGNKIKTLLIGSTVSWIDKYSFEDCIDLTSIVIDEANENLSSEENVVFSKDKTKLIFCLSTKQGEYNIPNSVTFIFNYAFQNCSGLTCVTIPNSVTGILEYTFAGCSGLTSVTIPNSVTWIREEAFSGCSSLTSVSIGNSVKTIGSKVFAECKNIETVYCYAKSVPETSVDVFEGSFTKFSTLYVPGSSLEAYKNANPWSEFGSILPLSEEQEGIENIVLGANKHEYYDLSGRRLNRPNTSLHIVNGKKQFVR